MQNTLNEYLNQYSELVNRGDSFVSVTLVRVRGSAPQDAGSKMLVTPAGLSCGTVGGGQLEQRAIEFAQEILGAHAAAATEPVATQLVEWNLQKDIGMTCGGVVTLYFEAVNYRVWHIAVFGAGHVANALVRLLGKLNCRITCIDPRDEWLDRLPKSSKLKTVQEENMPSFVEKLPDDAFVLCVTMGHATDQTILQEIFAQNRCFPYLGVIGSRAKRSELVRKLVVAGVPPDRAEQFLCPIGLDLGTNDPEEIAISIAAQLIQERDRLRAGL